tara:strand:- start:558 stop:755 length:198 start_codon:yes stop_codon:yes gene_type:complete
MVKGNKMPKAYSGNVSGKVGNRAKPPAGGNSPTIPSKGNSGNRFFKGENAGKSHQNLGKTASVKY